MFVVILPFAVTRSRRSAHLQPCGSIVNLQALRYAGEMGVWYGYVMGTLPNGTTLRHHLATLLLSVETRTQDVPGFSE